MNGMPQQTPSPWLGMQDPNDPQAQMQQLQAMQQQAAMQQNPQMMLAQNGQPNNLSQIAQGFGNNVGINFKDKEPKIPVVAPPSESRPWGLDSMFTNSVGKNKKIYHKGGE